MTLIDFDRYPIDQPGTPAYAKLVARCQKDLAKDGMFNLEGFMLDMGDVVAELLPKFASESFTHSRSHNIYFKKHVEGLPDDSPVLAQVQTTNHTLCADQLGQNALIQIYEHPAVVRFIADVTGKEALYTMPDPLARLNVMQYRDGEALNWHFDRSEFTTTILLQSPDGGGMFEYSQNLRSDDDPNFDGVTKLMAGDRSLVAEMPAKPGTLNVFAGKQTAHRVSPVQGDKSRIVAVLSYYETPDVMFSDTDRMGFFGRVS